MDEVLFAEQDFLLEATVFQETPVFCEGSSSTASSPDSEKQSLFTTIRNYGSLSVDIKEELCQVPSIFLQRKLNEYQVKLKQFPSVAETDVNGMARFMAFFDLRKVTSGDTNMLFLKYAQLPHSCRPTCASLVEGNVCTVRAVVKLNKGDPLTISYDPQILLQPTHARRLHLLKMAGFVCRCARCEDPRDDTRRFECSDEIRKPHFYNICQPTASSKPYVTNCSDCGEITFDPYDNPILLWESARLEPLFTMCEAMMGESHCGNYSSAKTFQVMRSTMSRGATPDQVNSGLNDILFEELRGKYHMRTSHILKLRAYVLAGMHGQEEAALQAAKECLIPYGWMPPEACVVHYIEMGHLLADLNTAEVNQFHTECTRKALRIKNIMSGRDSEESTVISRMTAFLVASLTPPEAPSDAHCMLCQERPGQAALTLRQCGQCRRVSFCSKRCQKAHWVVHKPTSKKR